MGVTLPSDVQTYTQICDDGGAESGALTTDQDLEQVIEAWPVLPAVIRAGIVAMVEATRQS